MQFFFDTETTGLPLFKNPSSDPNQPKIIQLAGVLSDSEKVHMSINFILQIDDFPIHPKALEAHGITSEVSNSIGFDPVDTLFPFFHLAMQADTLVAHNYNFDIRLLKIAYTRIDQLGMYDSIKALSKACTMHSTTKFCGLTQVNSNRPKWPKLEELYRILFDEELEGAHDALVDVMATRRCYYELVKREII